MVAPGDTSVSVEFIRTYWKGAGGGVNFRKLPLYPQPARRNKSADNSVRECRTAPVEWRAPTTGETVTTAGTVRRPPLTSDERTQLVGWLDLQRSFVRMKCLGLAEAHAHRQVLPSSPLMTVAGVVSHLRWVEYSWFHLGLLGVPDSGQTPWQEGGHPDAEMFVEDVPLARLLDEYDAECARSDEIVAAHTLDDVEKGRPAEEAASVRYILCHMIEETARHVGHLDAIRELLDGTTSYNAPPG
jgi:Protein of unknown function (DUF664)